MMEPKKDLSNPGRTGAIGRRHTERGRVLGLGVLAALLAVLVIWIWGTRNLDGLPDVGDPFDVAAARRPIDIPDSDNAYVLYVEAKGAMSKPTPALSRVSFDELTWAKAGDNVRDFVDKNRPALDLWREGSERPAAIYNQPGNLAIDTLLDVPSRPGGNARHGQGHPNAGRAIRLARANRRSNGCQVPDPADLSPRNQRRRAESAGNKVVVCQLACPGR
jgi:hypothetical protein